MEYVIECNSSSGKVGPEKWVQKNWSRSIDPYTDVRLKHSSPGNEHNSFLRE